MMKRTKHIHHVTPSVRDQKIDELVENQAFDEDAWENETEISPKSKPTSIRLSPRTIQRAKFFAKVHRQRGYQSWLKRIIEERVSAEYDLYRQLKKQTTKQ